MKQHITVEQLEELSEKGKDKLREWWTSSEGDWYARFSLTVKGEISKKDKPVEMLSFCDWDEYKHWNDPKDTSKFWITYPLLSIGQMIEFLDEQEGVSISSAVDDGIGYWMVYTNKGRFVGDELCDALWEAVKEELK